MKVLAGLMGCAVGWLTDEIIFVRVPRAAVAIVVDDRIRTLFTAQLSFLTRKIHTLHVEFWQRISDISRPELSESVFLSNISRHQPSESLFPFNISRPVP